MDRCLGVRENTALPDEGCSGTSVGEVSGASAPWTSPAGDRRCRPARRARRYDPGRRDRLVDTTLDVIAEQGVAAATHRAIARVADVPLGSLTYRFGSLTELLAAAFTRHVDTVAARFY